MPVVMVASTRLNVLLLGRGEVAWGSRPTVAALGQLVCVFKESLAQVRHELHVVKNLSDLHGGLHFAAAFRLLSLDADLDQLRGELVRPHFALAVHVRLVVVGQHLHVLLNAEKRVLDGSLLNQREEHRRDVGLPRDLVVLLEHLQSQVAPELRRRVSRCGLALLVNCVDHAEEVRVHFAKSDQVLA